MQIKGRTLIVEDGEKVRRNFETAAWWQEIALDGGEYPIRDMPRPPHGMVYATVPGRIVRQYFPSLFGGVAYGNRGIEELDEPTVYHWQSYAYLCKEAEPDDYAEIVYREEQAEKWVQLAGEEQGDWEAEQYSRWEERR